MDLSSIKLKHKDWRKIAKKIRRKRIRKQQAVERDKLLKEEEENHKCDPSYQLKLAEQTERQEKAEKIKHDEDEELWLRRELLSQKEFLEREKIRKDAEAKRELRHLEILKECENLRKADDERKEKRKLQEKLEKQKYEIRMLKIKEYIDYDGAFPEELRNVSESNPGKETCSFFLRTNACRFGIKCSRNHIRPHISRILLFPHFFSHIRIEQNKNTEYGSDFGIEIDENEICEDYRVFFEDIVPELEKFGKIENIRTCRNFEKHLRGNVFVEYLNERDALKAFLNLQGRFYAKKQINVEFSSITKWKVAICGLHFANKCPKGRICNYIHLFKNPGNKYNKPVNIKETPARNGFITRTITQFDEFHSSWEDIDTNLPKKDNLRRWSESPEYSNAIQANKIKNDKSPSKDRYKSEKLLKRINRESHRVSSSERHSAQNRSKSRSDSRSHKCERNSSRELQSRHRSRSRSRSRKKLTRESSDEIKHHKSPKSEKRNSSKHKTSKKHRSKSKAKEKKSKKKKKDKK